jgi:PAS domain S-box-containing protein
MSADKDTKSENQIKLLVESTDDLIWYIDSRCRLVYGNKSFHNYLSDGHNFGLNASPDNAKGDITYEEWRTYYGKVLNNSEKFSAEVRITKDNKPHIIECLFNPLFRNGKEISGVVIVGRDITDYKNTEFGLLESEFLLNETQLLSSIGGWNWNIKNSTMHWTKELFRLHDLSPDTEINTTTGLITNYINCYEESDRRRIISAFRKCREKGEPYDIELPFTSLKGKKIWIRTFAKPVIEKGQVVQIIGYMMDITKQKRAENALRASESKFRSLVEQASEILFLHNLEGKIVDVNQAAVRQTGYSREELLKLSVYDIDPDADKRKDKINFWDALKNSDKSIIETRHKRKDGSIYIAEVTLGKIFFDNEYYILALARDISERKRIEEEILKSRENLIKMNAEKDKFFSIIAHDLRTPFTAFLGYTELIAEELHTMTLDEIQNMINIIRKSAANLYGLLENLLQWSRLRRGITVLKPERFNVLSAVKKSIDLAAEAAQNKEIEIIYDIPEKVEVFADIHMFETIVRNLVSNSVKFTNRKGKIFISAYKNNHGKVEISVKDTGIGIEKNMLGNLFSLDGKINRKGTEGELSTGLGLILCKEFIDKHNESINVESEPDKGSTFSFTLPPP